MWNQQLQNQDKDRIKEITNDQPNQEAKNVAAHGNSHHHH